MHCRGELPASQADKIENNEIARKSHTHTHTHTHTDVFFSFKIPNVSFYWYKLKSFQLKLGGERRGRALHKSMFS